MNEQILGLARGLAEGVFRPHAQEADRGTVTGLVGENVRALAEAGYFGLGIPEKYGGMGADEATRREYAEIMASACGVTAFVQQQMHAGGTFVGNGKSEVVKGDLLPKFASGELLCGVAFSHLRRPGKPMVAARRVAGGYVVEGVAPWVTGWRLLDGLILGAVLEDGAHLFCYVSKVDNGTMTAGPEIPLVVMNASDTVEVGFEGLFVPEEYGLAERPAEALRRSDYCGISGGVYLPLGCARGSVHYLRELAEKRGDSELADAADALMREVGAVRREAEEWSGACADLPDYKAHALRARAGAITLAVRAAHALVTATGGSAHLLTNPAQRLMREAMFYTTTAQTADVRAATVDLLLSAECWS